MFSRESRSRRTVEIRRIDNRKRDNQENPELVDKEVRKCLEHEFNSEDMRVGLKEAKEMTVGSNEVVDLGIPPRIEE